MDMNESIASFLRYRDIPRGWAPKNRLIIPESEKTKIKDQEGLDIYLRDYFSKVDFSRTGIMLSGGVDSALLASYCPKGTLAFTLVYPEANGIDEIEHAKKYADRFGLVLVPVAVTFDDVLDFQDDLMVNKKAPLSPIEIGLYKMSLAALDYGLDSLISGVGADCVFGGLYNIMSRNWTNEEFIKRYTFLEPKSVMKNPIDSLEVFEPYKGTPHFSANRFMEDIFGSSTISYFLNATSLAGISLKCPYEYIKRDFELDMESMSNGNEKPILRSLFSSRSGNMTAPRKYPLPRPTKIWSKLYGSIENEEFYPDAYLRCENDEQRWILYSADHFLTLYKDKCLNHYDVAYTAGVYDMFHIGHLKLLNRASKICDKLIVGVTTDELDSYKGKTPVIKFEDRIKIIRSLPFVYKAVRQSDMNKVEACLKHKAHAVVVGSDWKNTDKWNRYEKELKEIGVDVVYFPYTKRISSTKLVDELKNKK